MFSSMLFKNFVYHASISLRNIFTNFRRLKSDKFYVRISGKYDLEIERFVWMDMEMTGLDIDRDTIMEVACIVTDSDLNIIAEGPHIIINHTEKALDKMNDWCKKHHAESGLSEKCLKSTVTITEAENKLMNFLEEYITKNTSPLAGNSVYMDRLFLRKYMKNVDNYLHYRIVDVSSLKEICRRWNPAVYKMAPQKSYKHRALDDIKESIEELKYYRENFFINQDQD